MRNKNEWPSSEWLCLALTNDMSIMSIHCYVHTKHEFSHTRTRTPKGRQVYCFTPELHMRNIYLYRMTNFRVPVWFCHRGSPFVQAVKSKFLVAKLAHLPSEVVLLWWARKNIENYRSRLRQESHQLWRSISQNGCPAASYRSITCSNLNMSTALVDIQCLVEKRAQHPLEQYNMTNLKANINDRYF